MTDREPFFVTWNNNMTRCTKAEQELRVGEAADMLAKGHSSTAVRPKRPKNTNYLDDKPGGLQLLHMN